MKPGTSSDILNKSVNRYQQAYPEKILLCNVMGYRTLVSIEVLLQRGIFFSLLETIYF
jgi:hypothetical protein